MTRPSLERLEDQLYEIHERQRHYHEQLEDFTNITQARWDRIDRELDHLATEEKRIQWLIDHYEDIEPDDH